MGIRTMDDPKKGFKQRLENWREKRKREQEEKGDGCKAKRPKVDNKSDEPAAKRPKLNGSAQTPDKAQPVPVPCKTPKRRRATTQDDNRKANRPKRDDLTQTPDKAQPVPVPCTTPKRATTWNPELGQSQPSKNVPFAFDDSNNACFFAAPMTFLFALLEMISLGSSVTAMKELLRTLRARYLRNTTL